ncbi:hypothetical protein Trydic_g21149 [Trypoxylus dichotomus]
MLGATNPTDSVPGNMNKNDLHNFPYIRRDTLDYLIHLINQRINRLQRFCRCNFWGAIYSAEETVEYFSDGRLGSKRFTRGVSD